MPDRTVQRSSSHNLSKIEQRASDCCHGNAVAYQPILAAQAVDSMKPDPGLSRTRAAGGRHVNIAASALHQRPKRRRAAVAEDRIRTAREYRGHPKSPSRQAAMADRVDAAVRELQPANGYAVVNRATADAHSLQLPARHDAVLAPRQIGDIPLY